MNAIEVKNATDHQLFELIQKDQEPAFDELYNRYWEQLFATIFSLTSEKAAAQDITQEIFIKLWLKRKHIENQNIVGYLFKIGKLEAYQHLRRHKISEKILAQVELIAFSIDTEDKVNFAMAQEQYSKCLEQLPTKTKEIFKLSREEHLTYQEISEQLGISVKAVEYHMANALRHFRLHFSEFMTALILLLIQ